MHVHKHFVLICYSVVILHFLLCFPFVLVSLLLLFYLVEGCSGFVLESICLSQCDSSEVIKRYRINNIILASDGCVVITHITVFCSLC